MISASLGPGRTTWLLCLTKPLAGCGGLYGNNKRLLPCWSPSGSPPLGGISWFRMGRICVSMWWIGCGCLGVIHTSSLEERPRVARSCPPAGLLWPSGLISPKEKGIFVRSSPKETDVFKVVVRPAGAILGTGRNSVTSSGWASLDVNRDDLVEVALAAKLQHSAMAHVAGSTSKEYVGPWNKFVIWCGEHLSFCNR